MNLILIHPFRKNAGWDLLFPILFLHPLNAKNALGFDLQSLVQRPLVHLPVIVVPLRNQEEIQGFRLPFPSLFVILQIERTVSAREFPGS